MSNARCIGLVSLLLVGLGSCQKQDADPSKKAVYDGPLMETTNVLTLVSDSAKLQVRLTAPLQQQFESQDIVYPKGVRVLFYSKDGKKVDNTIIGDYGKQEKNTSIYTVRGNVRVRNEEKQQRMYTEELFYDGQRNMVYTDSTMFAKIITPTDSISGYGLTYNMLTSRYKFMRVTGKLLANPVTPQ